MKGNCTTDLEGNSLQHIWDRITIVEMLLALEIHLFFAPVQMSIICMCSYSWISVQQISFYNVKYNLKKYSDVEQEESKNRRYLNNEVSGRLKDNDKWCANALFASLVSLSQNSQQQIAASIKRTTKRLKSSKSCKAIPSYRSLGRPGTRSGLNKKNGRMCSTTPFTRQRQRLFKHKQQIQGNNEWVQ